MTNHNDKCTGTQMFGCFQNELELVMEGKDTHDLARMAMSILSDAQEAAADPGANHEIARQFINRAKFILSEIARNHR